jgi:hypothetical protein
VHIESSAWVPDMELVVPPSNSRQGDDLSKYRYGEKQAWIALRNGDKTKYYEAPLPTSTTGLPTAVVHTKSIQ